MSDHFAIFCIFLAHVIQRIAPQEQLNLMAENAVVIAAAWQRRWIEFRDPDQYESGCPQGKRLRNYGKIHRAING